MSKTHSKRCHLCGFIDVIKWGKRNGRTRYYCKNCGSYFTDRREHISDKNMFIWFERWILGKQSIAQLLEQSSYSERTLNGISINCCLPVPNGRYNVARKSIF